MFWCLMASLSKGWKCLAGLKPPVGARNCKKTPLPYFSEKNKGREGGLFIGQQLQ